MYLKVPVAVRPFLYIPDTTGAASVTFSARYDSEAELLASLRGSSREKVDTRLEALSQRLESLRHLSAKLSSIDDVAGLAQEEKLLKAMAAAPTSSEPKKESRIIGVVKGFLPKRKEKQEAPTAEEERDRKVKKITPIKKKK